MVLKNWFNITIIIILFSTFLTSQSEMNNVINKAFQEKIESYIDNTVPQISVTKAYAQRENFYFLDAREIEEFEVSHIEGAQHIGYDDFSFSTIESIPKTTPIVIYCSIGYRSEKIGEKLANKGFTNVQNLYGSIFEWVNQGFPIINASGEETMKLHTYNEDWSQWISNKKIIKIW